MNAYSVNSTFMTVLAFILGLSSDNTITGLRLSACICLILGVLIQATGLFVSTLRNTEQDTAETCHNISVETDESPDPIQPTGPF